MIDDKGKLVEKNTPNFCGFCSFAGISAEDFSTLKLEFPSVIERILSRLEDEALNSQLSSSILSNYLKKISSSYFEGENAEKNTINQEESQIKIIFEHDALCDGS